MTEYTMREPSEWEKRRLHYSSKPGYVLTYAEGFNVFKIDRLRDLSGLDNLRWRIKLQQADSEKLLEKTTDRICQLGEAFVPSHNFKDRECEYPRRLAPFSYSGEVEYDFGDEHWAIAHGGHALEALAATALLGEREDRISQEKLTLGQTYYDTNDRLAILKGRVKLVDRAIFEGIWAQDVLKGPRYLNSTIVKIVIINGRYYPFSVSSNGVSRLTDQWPSPSAQQEIFIQPTATFAIDDSLVGVDEDHARIRLGEPERKLKNGDWVYGKYRLSFSRHGWGKQVVTKIRKVGKS